MSSLTRPNGFVERPKRTVLDEFFRMVFRTTFYETVEALQTDLDAWLWRYNYELPYQGYRNLCKRPFERIEQFLVEQQNFPPVLDPPAASTGLHWILSLAGRVALARLLKYRSLEKKVNRLYGMMAKSTDKE